MLLQKLTIFKPSLQETNSKFEYYFLQCIAVVCSTLLTGEVVTMHVTFLCNGRMLSNLAFFKCKYTFQLLQ